MENQIEVELIHDWFKKNGRPLPWRENRTPYRVWISEVMLQQTRASVVIPYFDRWMRLFPDVKVLANAPLDRVIKAWEGLGYYGRARHLHEAARQMVAQHGGQIPSRREDLERIKGLGPYTVNALLSFAFHKRAAAIDGNVARFLTRYFLIEENLSRQATKKKVQALGDQILDEKKPWVTAEALIELGATICQPKPLCAFCPLQHSCLALKHDKVDVLPIKNKNGPITILQRAVAVVEESECLLVRKGIAGRVMADLYEFPYFEGLEIPLPQHLRACWSLETRFVKSLPFVQHHFTRFQAHLFPIHLRAAVRVAIEHCVWVPFQELEHLPFSSGHKRVLHHFLKRLEHQPLLF